MFHAHMIDPLDYVTLWCNNYKICSFVKINMYMYIYIYDLPNVCSENFIPQRKHQSTLTLNICLVIYASYYASSSEYHQKGVVYAILVN